MSEASHGTAPRSSSASASTGPLQCSHFGPDFRTLVRIRTFLGKVVRIWSGFCSKVRIFHKIKERTLKTPHFNVC